MSQFADEFSRDEFGLQVVTQIPWGTLVTVIIPKSKYNEEMLYYINETHKIGWSRSMVLNQNKEKITSISTSDSKLFGAAERNRTVILCMASTYNNHYTTATSHCYFIPPFYILQVLF